MPCPCVVRHTPKPAYFQKHHILPQAWGGKTVSANLMDLCGTTHDATHEAMNRMVRAARAGTTPDLKGIPKFAQELAWRALNEYMKTHVSWPTVLTVAYPPGVDHADTGLGMEAERGPA